MPGPLSLAFAEVRGQIFPQNGVDAAPSSQVEKQLSRIDLAVPMGRVLGESDRFVTLSVNIMSKIDNLTRTTGVFGVVP